MGFLLMSCVTGLPLIFADEINHYLMEPRQESQVRTSSPQGVSVDGMIAESHRLHPKQQIANIAIDDDRQKIVITMMPTWGSFAEIRRNSEQVRALEFDRNTGLLLRETGRSTAGRSRVVSILLELHGGLFAGILGGFLLGIVALLFLTAIITGAILYGPFRKKMGFGDVRSGGTARIGWLDTHNLLGVVLCVWLIGIASTGFLNEMALPLFAFWERSEVRHLVGPWQHESVRPQVELGSAQSALDAVKRALPQNAPVDVLFPGGPVGTPRHYVVVTRGTTSIKKQMLTPVLVDTQTSQVTVVANLPWYLQMLEIARPLHYGNYGGLPLKVIWAIFDLMMIGLLITGFFLWRSKASAQSATRRVAGARKAAAL